MPVPDMGERSCRTWKPAGAAIRYASTGHGIQQVPPYVMPGPDMAHIRYHHALASTRHGIQQVPPYAMPVPDIVPPYVVPVRLSPASLRPLGPAQSLLLHILSQYRTPHAAHLGRYGTIPPSPSAPFPPSSPPSSSTAIASPASLSPPPSPPPPPSSACSCTLFSSIETITGPWYKYTLRQYHFPVQTYPAPSTTSRYHHVSTGHSSGRYAGLPVLRWSCLGGSPVSPSSPVPTFSTRHRIAHAFHNTLPAYQRAHSKSVAASQILVADTAYQKRSSIPNLSTGQPIAARRTVPGRRGHPCTSYGTLRASAPGTSILPRQYQTANTGRPLRPLTAVTAAPSSLQPPSPQPQARDPGHP
eukprot:819340-Rhodomonas_salina.1